MKIALFTDSFLPGIGGTENVVLRLAKELSKEHSVMVFAPDYHRPYEENLQLPFKVFRAKSIAFTKNECWALPSLTKNIVKVLDEFKPDILHTHTIGMMAGFANSYGKKNNIPVVCTVHTNFRACYKNVLKINLFVKILLAHVIKRANKADRVCSVSYKMIEELKSYGLKGKQVTIVRNGFEKPIEKEIIKEQNEKFTLLFVGMLADYKNIAFSLKCLKELKKMRSDFVFYIVGRGPQEKKFKKLVKKFGLGEEVIFTGAITDKEQLKKIYGKSDLFLFTSLIDNDALVLMEAAQRDTPSLVIENTGSSERFTNDKTGFIVENDKKAVAKKIDELMEDREKLHTVGKNAKTVVVTWDKVSEEYLDIYKEEIEKKKIK